MPTVNIATENRASDATLIAQCAAVIDADAAFRLACDNAPSADADALATRRQELLQPALAARATGIEAIQAKAAMVASLYDWPGDASKAERRDHLVASLLRDLGATVPEGFAT